MLAVISKSEGWWYLERSLEESMEVEGVETNWKWAGGSWLKLYPAGNNCVLGENRRRRENGITGGRERECMQVVQV